MVLLIDNYDSFTYNLYQCVGSLETHPRIEVRRNDEIALDQIDTLQPTHLIISPGPCTPSESGISMSAIRHLAGRIPILGVCLGHQCIAAAFGGVVGRAERLMHGKTSPICHDGRTIFTALDNPFTATRYHSLDVGRDALPDEFELSAWTEDRNEVMAIRHKSLPIEGVQFHPESFLTQAGPKLIANFLAM